MLEDEPFLPSQRLDKRSIRGGGVPPERSLVKLERLEAAKRRDRERRSAADTKSINNTSNPDPATSAKASATAARLAVMARFGVSVSGFDVAH